MVYFGHHTEKNTQSVGLVFEPDSFICYLFGSPNGDLPIGYMQFDTQSEQHAELIRSAQPAFGVFFTTEYTLLPPSVFSESELQSYLRFTSPATGDLAVAYERLFRSETVLVYRDDAHAQSYAGKLQPGLQLRHAAGVLIEAIQSIQSEIKGERIYLHQAGDFYTTIIFKDAQLLLATSSRTEFTDDVRYYLLYCRKMLKIKDGVQLCLLGQATGNDALRESLENVMPGTISGLPERKVANLPDGVDLATFSMHFVPLSAAQCV